jgi:hypothetical protein
MLCLCGVARATGLPAEKRGEEQVGREGEEKEIKSMQGHQKGALTSQTQQKVNTI